MRLPRRYAPRNDDEGEVESGMRRIEVKIKGAWELMRGGVAGLMVRDKRKWVQLPTVEEGDRISASEIPTVTMEYSARQAASRINLFMNENIQFIVDEWKYDPTSREWIRETGKQELWQGLAASDVGFGRLRMAALGDAGATVKQVDYMVNGLVPILMESRIKAGHARIRILSEPKKEGYQRMRTFAPVGEEDGELVKSLEAKAEEEKLRVAREEGMKNKKRLPYPFEQTFD